MGRTTRGPKTLPPEISRALDALAENRSIRGITAARLAWGAHKAEAAPGWSGIGADYKAWVEALCLAPGNPEAALNLRAPERAYLAILNGAKHFLVLHLHRWTAPEGACSRFEGCIVAFEGEVRDKYGLPLFWRFDKDDEDLACPPPGKAVDPCLILLDGRLRRTVP
jgi:hypothetical protein